MAGLPARHGPRPVSQRHRTHAPSVTRGTRVLFAPAWASASCVRLSRTASLPCTPLVAARYITWGIMRERAGGVAIQALCGPRIIHAMQNAALVVTKAVSMFRRPGARRSVGSCVRGAHLFIETATSPTHHEPATTGLAPVRRAIHAVWPVRRRGRRVHGGRVVSR